MAAHNDARSRYFNHIPSGSVCCQQGVLIVDSGLLQEVAAGVQRRSINVAEDRSWNGRSRIKWLHGIASFALLVRPVQVLVQKREGPHAVDLVRADEDFDLAAVGDA